MLEFVFRAWEGDHGDMKNEKIVAARKAAEKAVEDMESGPLKRTAFQTILTQLLLSELGSRGSAPPNVGALRSTARRKGGTPRANGTTGRLLSLIDESIFSEPRSLAEIKQTLSEKGFRYRLEDLGTPLKRLVQRKYLRRAQELEGGKKVWKYSNY
jgi:hypothetical protein